jgi:glycosyltransferase involved in cell wall biosynthesis
MTTPARYVFLSGTNGLPGRYGGWDPLLSQLSLLLAQKGFKVIVHCEKSLRSVHYNTTIPGIERFFLPVKANGATSILYDLLCMMHALVRRSPIILLGTSGGIFLPLFAAFGLKSIVNLDGEEWNRSKWSFWARKFLVFSDYCSILAASCVVCDHPAILKRVSNIRSFGVSMIAYGCDHVLSVPPFELGAAEADYYPFINTVYFFSVCRIEPENNIHLTLEAFSCMGMPNLVIMGNWTNSEYGRSLLVKFGSFKNIYLLPACYDISMVNLLRMRAFAYIHGHTVGGTNPSLLEAAVLNGLVLAHDNVFNRHVLGSDALYFLGSSGLREHVLAAMNGPLSRFSDIRQRLMARVSSTYKWHSVCHDYLNLVQSIS